MEDVDAVFDKAIFTYGWQAQVNKTIEECAELIQVLAKLIQVLAKRGNEAKLSQEARMAVVDEVVDEVADVEIMCAQLKKIYWMGDLVEERKKYKLDRLNKRLGERNE